MSNIIEVNNLTLKYPNGKGIFDVTFELTEGEVSGYLGPNGAGKTTTMRCLLGFTKPDSGTAKIKGLDCIADAPKIQKFLGYIPGEISFLNGLSGTEFLEFMCKMRGTKDMTIQNRLLDMFELNPKGKIRRFSKGMKQKIGIVTAFMHDPEVVLLDEPSSGLDPLMQSRFIELVAEEKKRGKTIIMSSHMFEEVERTCDEVLIIKDGYIVARDNVQGLKDSQRKAFIVTFKKNEDIDTIKNAGFETEHDKGNKADVYVKGDEISKFIKLLNDTGVVALESKFQTLEDIFMNFYGRGERSE